MPVWDEKICIQCGKCSLVCPHATIRAKVYDKEALAGAPPTFKVTAAKWKDFRDQLFTLQVAVEDCTGCTLCVEVCPVKDKSDVKRKAINMAPQIPLREPERSNWDFFLSLPEMDRQQVKPSIVKDTQLYQPLFEFSGACVGCGETPYIKLMTQLFGDRAIIGNATGCSSIYGGNLPTTPYTVNLEGRGPAWNNSLFEDAAEFTLGLRLAVDQHNLHARDLLDTMRQAIGGVLVDEILKADQSDDAGIQKQRERVRLLRERLTGIDSPDARRLDTIADYLVKNASGQSVAMAGLTT